MSQNAPKTTYEARHKKSATPNQKLSFQVQTRRLADPFQPLSSSLVQSAEELWLW